MGNPNDIDTPFKNEVRDAARDFVEILANLSLPRMFDPDRVVHITVAYRNIYGGLDRVMFVTTKEIVEDGPETRLAPASSGPSSGCPGRASSGPEEGK